MALHDVFALEGVGYVLDVQSDLLDPLNTRVVVPLMPEVQAPRPARRLNPVFEIEGTPHVLVTQYLSAMPLSDLGKPVGNLAEHAPVISNALDMVFHGF